MKQFSNKDFPKSNDLIVSVNHKEPEDDDCGLPEHPIFSNYVKHLWKAHSQNPRIRKNLKSPEHMPPNN